VGQNHTVWERLWLHNFINKVTHMATGPVTTYSDNLGAITLAKDNKFHARTKHINIWYHFIWEAVQKGQLMVKFIPGSENLADIFTKPLPKSAFVKLVKKLRLCKLKGECWSCECAYSWWLCNQNITPIFLMPHLIFFQSWDVSTYLHSSYNFILIISSNYLLSLTVVGLQQLG